MDFEFLSGVLLGVSRGKVKSLQYDNVVVPSAFIKEPVGGPVWLGTLGVVGDEHAYKHHGGPNMAVCVYPIEYYPWWQRRIPFPIPGVAAFGENFTVNGLTDDIVCLGDRFKVGDAVIEIKQPRLPCFKIAKRYGVPQAAVWMQRESMTGYLCSVPTEGYVEAGQSITLQKRESNPITVAEANRILHLDRKDKDGARKLMMFRGLPEDLHAKLHRRL